MITRALCITAALLAFCSVEVEGLQGLRVSDGVLLGQLEQPLHEVFGEVTAIAFSSAGHIIVADGQYQEVRSFDRDGNFLGTVGRPGRGPGEFGSISSLTPLGGSQILVTDKLNGRISVVTIGEHGQLEVAATHPTHLAANDICTNEHGTFLLGVSGKYLIHHYDSEFSSVKSFGEPFRPLDGPSRSPMYGYGKLACLDGEGVVAASQLLGTIRRYETGGTLVWEVELPSFQPLVLRQVGRVTHFENAPGGVDALITMSTLEGLVLVQTVHLDDYMTGIRPGLPITTFILDSGTGRIVWSTDEVPRIDAIGPGLAAGVGDSDVPQLRIWRQLEVRGK